MYCNMNSRTGHRSEKHAYSTTYCLVCMATVLHMTSDIFKMNLKMIPKVATFTKKGDTSCMLQL